MASDRSYLDVSCLVSHSSQSLHRWYRSAFWGGHKRMLFLLESAWDRKSCAAITLTLKNQQVKQELMSVRRSWYRLWFSTLPPCSYADWWTLVPEYPPLHFQPIIDLPCVLVRSSDHMVLTCMQRMERQSKPLAWPKRSSSSWEGTNGRLTLWW